MEKRQEFPTNVVESVTVVKNPSNNLFDEIRKDYLEYELENLIEQRDEFVDSYMDKLKKGEIFGIEYLESYIESLNLQIAQKKSEMI